MKMKCICVTYAMIWERLSQSKPYNKTSCKQPPFKGYRNNFLASWFYGSSLFFKSLARATWPMVWSPCLLYVKLRSEYTKNFQ